MEPALYCLAQTQRRAGYHPSPGCAGQDHGAMKWFAETTEWADTAMPNGIYLLDDAKTKMYAFRAFGTGEIKTFKNFIRIDTRGRKFVLNPEQFKTQLKEPEPEGRVWTVMGSKGDQYQVTESSGNLSCSCSGFRFRGKCKHEESIRQKI